MSDIIDLLCPPSAGNEEEKTGGGETSSGEEGGRHVYRHCWYAEVDDNIRCH